MRSGSTEVPNNSAWHTEISSSSITQLSFVLIFLGGFHLRRKQQAFHRSAWLRHGKFLWHLVQTVAETLAALPSAPTFSIGRVRSLRSTVLELLRNGVFTCTARTKRVARQEKRVTPRHSRKIQSSFVYLHPFHSSSCRRLFPLQKGAACRMMFLFSSPHCLVCLNPFDDLASPVDSRPVRWVDYAVEAAIRYHRCTECDG